MGGHHAEESARRLSELTEHLMNKQRHIEVIESEKSALQLRVETLVREMQNVLFLFRFFGILKALSLLNRELDEGK
jgi:hypothetical protein